MSTRPAAPSRPIQRERVDDRSAARTEVELGLVEADISIATAGPASTRRRVERVARSICSPRTWQMLIALPTGCARALSAIVSCAFRCVQLAAMRGIEVLVTQHPAAPTTCASTPPPGSRVVSMPPPVSRAPIDILHLPAARLSHICHLTDLRSSTNRVNRRWDTSARPRARIPDFPDVACGRSSADDHALVAAEG